MPAPHMPAGRGALFVSLGAGVAAFGATVLAPFYQDDLIQRAMALGRFPAARGVFDLYDFARASDTPRFVESGVLPWWTDERFTLRFFRPLASALLYAEHRFVGSAPVMHLISLAWWAAAVAAAWWLFRRHFVERAAAIATFVFALAPCHAAALSLLAQREVLIAIAFATLGLGVLASAPDGGRLERRRALVAAVLFAVSMGAGEYGLCFGGYAVALAVTSRRIDRALPFAVPAAIYLAARAALGYGASGTGFYRDPIHAPGHFISSAPRSFAVLAANAWSSFDAERLPLWLAALVTIAVVAFAVRVTPAGPLRWLMAGSFLSLAPLLASTPGHRLIGPAMLGVAPALGVLIDRALAAPRRIALTLAAVAAGALHLVHAPVASFLESRESLHYARRLAERTIALDRASTGALGVVGLAAWETAFFTAVGPDARTPPMPWHVLVTARHALLLRTGDRTLDVVVPKGQGFFPVGADNMFRPEDAALHAGDERDVAGMHVLVVSDGEGGAPPRMRFTFDRSLEDPSFVWLTETRGGYETIEPPREGFGAQLSP